MHFKKEFNKKYKTNKISEVDKVELSEFYKKTFYQRYKNLTNNWRWWYRVGYDKQEPIILSIDNKIIGQASYLPTKLNVLGNEISAIWFVDYAILPEYMGKGLGKFLCEEWMKICPNQMAICSPYSLRVLKKFGWKENLTTQRLAKPINILKFLPGVRHLKLNFLDSTIRHFVKRKFNNNYLIKPFEIVKNFKVLNESFKLKKSEKNNGLAQIVRDEKWLYWRLMECPYKKDIFFFELNNNFAIVHIFLVKNIKKLNILYTYSTDNLQENELITKIINWSLNNSIDLVWSINRKKNLENIFPAILNKPVQYACWSSDSKTFEVLKKGLSDFHGIDSDNDTSLYIE
jgi:hypothetical protein